MLVNESDTASQRERILDVAERLFMARGLASVTLRDIGGELGLTHAALYYHFPGGKEALFTEVAERNIRRHGAGLDAAIKAAGPRLGPRLKGAAAWLIGQPPMDLIRMSNSDLVNLPEEDSRRLMGLIYGLMLRRLEGVIAEALETGEIEACDPGLVAGGLLGMVESLHSVPAHVLTRSRTEMAWELLGLLLKGLGYREGGKE